MTVATTHFNNLKEKLASNIIVNQESYLYFGGTAYLGIPQNQQFIDYYIEGITKFGLNNGTSRGNNVQIGIYNDVEAYIAAKYGSADALITSSGYLAAKLVVQAYAHIGEIRYAPNTHPALWNNEDPKINLDFTTWSSQIVEEINQSENLEWIIISNSMNNLYPEIYNFDFIKNLDSHKNITLILDDSHGIGMLNNGTSVLSKVPKRPNVSLLIIASMAKALGVDAGVVLGSIKEIEKLKLGEVFYGASPPAAAGLHAFMHADEIYKTAYQKLQTNINLFNEGLVDKSQWHSVNGFPVFLCYQADIVSKLAQKNILISSFPYPDRTGTILNRIVLSSWHSESDIKSLLAALQN